MSKRGAQIGNKNRVGKAPWNKGIKVDKEKYPNIGHRTKHNEETRKKMSEKAKGRKYSAERNKKISEFQKNRIRPRMLPQKYSSDWDDILREKIRNRDEYVCKECGIHQEELDGFLKKLDVHHIDYDKNNCNLNNLITLCRSCHLKTNSKRQYWTEYFNQLTK